MPKFIRGSDNINSPPGVLYFSFNIVPTLTGESVNGSNFIIYVMYDFPSNKSSFL